MCVCLSVPCRTKTLRRAPRCNCGCPLVVHYWAHLQSVHVFRCYATAVLIRTTWRKPAALDVSATGRRSDPECLFGAGRDEVWGRGTPPCRWTGVHEGCRKKLTVIYGRIAEISVSYGKSGSRNSMVTSDFTRKIKIWPFRACAMKNML